MAESPAHRFGQIIGDTLERAIRPLFEAIARDLGLYLDGKGERKARGTRRKVAWVDGKGNTHDLDYVFEAGGDADTVGTPKRSSRSRGGVTPSTPATRRRKSRARSCRWPSGTAIVIRSSASCW